MTKCEKCYCEFEEIEMVIKPQKPGEKLKFLCKECFDLERDLSCEYKQNCVSQT